MGGQADTHTKTNWSAFLLCPPMWGGSAKVQFFTEEKTMQKELNFDVVTDKFFDEERRQRRIQKAKKFFELLKEKKSVRYIRRSWLASKNYHDLLAVEEEIMPIPLFLQIRGENSRLTCEEFVQLVGREGIQVDAEEKKFHVFYKSGMSQHEGRNHLGQRFRYDALVIDSSNLMIEYAGEGYDWAAPNNSEINFSELAVGVLRQVSQEIGPEAALALILYDRGRTEWFAEEVLRILEGVKEKRGLTEQEAFWEKTSRSFLEGEEQE